MHQTTGETLMESFRKASLLQAGEGRWQVSFECETKRKKKNSLITIYKVHTLVVNFHLFDQPDPNWTGPFCKYNRQTFLRGPHQSRLAFTQHLNNWYTHWGWVSLNLVTVLVEWGQKVCELIWEAETGERAFKPGRERNPLWRHFLVFNAQGRRTQ